MDRRTTRTIFGTGTPLPLPPPPLHAQRGKKPIPRRITTVFNKDERASRERSPWKSTAVRRRPRDNFNYYNRLKFEYLTADEEKEEEELRATWPINSGRRTFLIKQHLDVWRASAASI